MRTLALFALCLLAAPTVAQDGSSVNDRELAGLIEEQTNLIRQLTRLRSTMQVLLERIEAEGRTRTAELLRGALVRLDERQAETAGTEELTLAERMERARVAMREGRLVQSIERQDQLVQELTGLLDILLDRQSLERLQDELEAVRDLRERVDQLAREERRLQEETRKLRERSANDEQRALEAALTELAKQEAERLRASETEARQTGAFELEAIERELSQVLADQRVDEQVFDGWRPDRDPAWTAAREALERAVNAAGEARTERAAGERLEAAARRLEEGDASAQELERTLAEEAEALRRDARVAPSASRERRAEAFERALEAARSAEAGETSPAEAAQALREAARPLTETGEGRRRATQQELDRAAEALRQLAAQEPNERDRALAEELAEQVEAAATERRTGDVDRADAALGTAAKAMERAAQDREYLPEALAGSQEQQAARTERLERAIEALPERASDPETREAAREALQEAAEAMRRASADARNREAQGGEQASREARERLERALEQLASAAGERDQAGRETMREMAAAEAQAAERVEELRQQLSEGSMGPEAEARANEALERAQQAMERSAGELSEGRPATAAEAQRDALEALRDAQREAQEGVRPESAEDRQRAEDLAAEQRRIREQILDLARRMQDEEQERPRDTSNLERAQDQAERAESSLREGDLSEAEEREQEVERELQQLEQDLAEEEEQYQRLRQEELLFRIAEEVAGLLETHEAQMTELAELDRARSPGKEPSRAQRLQLRRIAREESAIASRSAEMAEAIEAEGSMVSAELLRSAQSDLDRVAEALSERGDFETGERTQALQRDVRESFEWLLEALRQELERRQNEAQQEQQQQQQGEQPQQDEALVPDTAELKLLRRMEVEIQEDVRQLRVLYPDLGDGDVLDDLALADVTRLAVKHQRIAELFRSMRERIGIPAAGEEPAREDGPNDPPVEGDDR